MYEISLAIAIITLICYFILTNGKEGARTIVRNAYADYPYPTMPYMQEYLEVFIRTIYQRNYLHKTLLEGWKRNFLMVCHQEYFIISLHTNISLVILWPTLFINKQQQQ